MARQSRTAETPRPGRALVRDMTGAAGAASPAPTVVMEARPAVDFLVSLMMDPEAEILPVDRAWREEARASLSDALRRDFARVVGDEKSSKGLATAIVPIVMVHPEVGTAADVVALAAKIDARALVDALCDADEMQAGVDLANRILAGERDLRDAAVEAWPEPYRASIGRLLDDPAAELRALRRVLRAWAERFAAIEPRVAAMEQRDVAARKADLERLSLPDLVERTTGGVRWVPEPGTTRLFLCPSYFTRPYNWIFGGRDWHMFAYPIADAALDQAADAVPAASIRLFKALGDESRLRILRLLASGDLYLTEIADRMGLSKPTVSHHLAHLRAAGLVTITEAGALTYYSLRRDRIGDAGTELARVLGEPSQ